MNRVIALDVIGKEIKHNDLVKIVETPDSEHSWTKVGNTLRVAYWEDRSWGGKTEYICVFLKSKIGGKLCSQGVQDIKLEVIERE